MMDATTKAVILELIAAAGPFTSGDVVDETSGTIPLMDRLQKAIEAARKHVAKENV